jgi:hypothetical protein
MGQVVERRKHKRYMAPHGVFAVLAVESHFAKLGQIMDVSRGGLSFSYAGTEEWISESSELDILFPERKFRLDNLPFKTVSDFEMVGETLASDVAIRRRGVRFGGLTYEQKFELEQFIRRDTLGELETLNINQC